MQEWQVIMEQTLTNLHLLAEGLERDTETWMVRPNCSTDSYMLCRRVRQATLTVIALSLQWNVTGAILCG